MSIADLLIAADALGLKGDDLAEAAKMLNGGEEDPGTAGLVADLLGHETTEKE
jgi:hypothetical protein